MGKFIVLEGLEGSGKTTVALYIVKILKSYGIKNVILTREPGSTPISEIFRTLIKYGKDGDQDPITSYAELLMFYAARVQLLENVIKPSLLKGIWIVGDRYDFSSYAYQGGGRRIDKYFIKNLSRVVLNNFRPDITFYLDISPKIGLSRIENKRKLDHIEKESMDFFNRVRLSYQALASENLNVVTIDASQTLNQVNSDVQYYIKKLLKI
ncbi:dTMP kinase [Blochmannia endosymbiont of Polyrhachis (Hedomyrma) turneri]|uniref:dTMP kinase n=1 Tax=Blochmannia endosymbiont of Polyrhachis (Hedomyrma) turneri TaxID=1505596 RepID=UPI00061B24BB|nr:dTMP kinase [Blochmannia endosymbiont of Polyrhachis (Hedomyrma) turneri]